MRVLWLVFERLPHPEAVCYAAGEADVYPRFGPTMEWDTAAGDAILRAAGGTAVTPEGAAFTYGKDGYRNGAFIACAGYRFDPVSRDR